MEILPDDTLYEPEVLATVDRRHAQTREPLAGGVGGGREGGMGGGWRG